MRLHIFHRGGRIRVSVVAVHHPAQVRGAPGAVAAPSARLAPPNPGRFLVFVAQNLEASGVRCDRPMALSEGQRLTRTEADRVATLRTVYGGARTQSPRSIAPGTIGARSETIGDGERAVNRHDQANDDAGISARSARTRDVRAKLTPRKIWTTAQLNAIGLDYRSINRVVEERSLHRVERGVYVRAPAHDHLLLRALARNRPSLVYSGPTAAHLYGHGRWNGRLGAGSQRRFNDGQRPADAVETRVGCSAPSGHSA